jgi:hypothetical protein
MKIQFIDLQAQYRKYHQEIGRASAFLTEEQQDYIVGVIREF